MRTLVLCTLLWHVCCIQSERGRKHAEAELGEVSARVSEMSVTITNVNNDKRRLEADLANLQAELEEALTARGAAEDRADRAQAELGRLAEELRQVRPSVAYSLAWTRFLLNILIIGLIEYMRWFYGRFNRGLYD